MIIFTTNYIDMTIRNWIKQQESLGKPTFSYRDVKVNFSDMPEQHIMNELYRLSRQKIIQSVYKSFYTVIPIQYSVRGIVPPHLLYRPTDGISR